MHKALLVRRFGNLTPQLRKRLFPGWGVHALFDRTLIGRRYDVIVVGFLEETQREMEWVEETRTALNKGGKFIRIA